MKEIGIDTAAVRERIGLGEGRPRRPAHELLISIWDAAREVSGESGIGVRIAERSRVEDWALLGGLTTSSATLGQAMIAMTRMAPAVTSAVRLGFSVEADRCTWTLDPVRRGVVHPEHLEYLVATAMVLARRNLVQTMPVIEVSFSHEGPSDTSHHRRVFGVVPVFRAPNSGCVFDSRLLEFPLTSHDANAHASLSQQAERILEQTPDPNDLRQRTREAISIELMNGEPTSERVAARLDMHPKALSRGLAALGTSYREVRDGLRYALAARYLRRSRLSIEDVALRLGYSEASAFHRAFRRWSGRSPLEYRRSGGD